MKLAKLAEVLAMHGDTNASVTLQTRPDRVSIMAVIPIVDSALDQARALSVAEDVQEAIDVDTIRIIAKRFNLPEAALEPFVRAGSK